MWEYEVTELSVLCDACHKEAHKAKDEINDFCLMYGAGSERVISELVGGYSSYQNGLQEHCNSHMNCVGYGAGYLQNLEAETILKLTKISPDRLQKFIEEAV